MKKTTIANVAALGVAALFAGCASPRYTTIDEYYPPAAAERQDAMTLETASKIVGETLAAVPAERRPSHPGDRTLGMYTTSIRLRRNDRPEPVLVELKVGRKVVMEFCVPTQEDGERFAAAVWRLRREYRGK